MRGNGSSEVLIDLKAAAKQLDCSESKLRQMVREDQIPFVRVGNRLKFLPSKLAAWVEARVEGSVR